MAEPVGLAVGFIGLAGLFSTCVDCFKLVQVYDSRSHDYEILQTMLDNQQFHFMAWGKACGFMNPDRINTRFEDPLSELCNMRIEQTMERIQSLLTNGDNLKEQYGLKVHRVPLGSRLIEQPGLSAFSKVFQNTKVFWNTSLQRKSQISGTIRWAISDKDKFDKLVQNLRDLLADLTKLTEDIGVADSQLLIVEYELEMIDDEPSLETIAAVSACDDDDDLLSHAASRRLSRVKAQSVANHAVGFHDSVSMVSVERYSPSTSTIAEEDMEGLAQDIGITRVPISQWRKVKTRAGIVPWLKTLVVATSTTLTNSDIRDDIQPISRTNTLIADVEPNKHERTVRLAINSRTLISVLRKIAAYRFSPKHNVLVYPFKPLLTYEKELRHYLANTEEKLHQLVDTQSKTPKAVVGSMGLDLPMKPKADESAASEVDKVRRTVEEMQCLIHFIEEDMHDLLAIKRGVVERNLRKISFEHLWILFQPGNIVVSSDDGSDTNTRAYQVLHVTGGRPILDIENHSKSEKVENDSSWDSGNQDGYAFISSRECTDFSIDCFYIDFDGTAYGPRPERFIIPEFSGERDISSLPVYPASQVELNQGLMDRLLKRGLWFVLCTNVGHYLYHGLVLKEWDCGHREICVVCNRTNKQEQIDSEVIIDHLEAIENCKACGCRWAPSYGGSVITRATMSDRRETFETVDCSIPNCKTCTDIFDDAAVDLNLRDRFIRSSRSLRAISRHNLSNDQLLLLPYRVCGYSLHHRKWYPLNVAQLQLVEVATTAFEELILPQGHKDMLSALIRTETQVPQQGAPENYDLIKGKSRGILILLHGAPGVGKTSTAEALASSLKRPLFTLKIADLGSTSGELRQNLAQILRWTERWNCILLVREADAILARVSKSDREGSHITSVFIDSLEYFSGILIMTTSRVGMFDEAIMSRIHVSLYYPPLDRDTTMKLWSNGLKRIDAFDDDIVEFLKHQYNQGQRWNGRQIRNGIATAVALAQEEAKRRNKKVILYERHFKAVANSSREFSDYLTAMHQEDRAVIATDIANRSDHFAPQGLRRSKVPLESTYKAPREEDEGSDEDLEVQELELKLQMAKLKRRQKELKAKRANRSQRRDTSDEEF